ncbi:hypothetical protein HELRODRAFT_162970 [Helobdella robusta]|uniref:Endonuclease/exonuclease/phosphatase domain-containing protein n=1 Tax=Helobdella robusta TaxID=6412 RepID=T1ETG5_HELRO|nr:hypothetical protein HELRODRAFT_162970 [Helobdella robusta]ESN99422.1 hypothetical protein HELRODRAFT_162970 [Helobdella robusta]
MKYRIYQEQRPGLVVRPTVRKKAVPDETPKELKRLMQKIPRQTPKELENTCVHSSEIWNPWNNEHLTIVGSYNTGDGNIKIIEVIKSVCIVLNVKGFSIADAIHNEFENLSLKFTTYSSSIYFTYLLAAKTGFKLTSFINQLRLSAVKTIHLLYAATLQLRKTTAPSPQQALSDQGVPRIPGKYAIAEGCCRKIQNGPSMVLRLGTLNVGSLTGRSMEIAEMFERRRIDICCFQETRWKSNGVCHVNSDKEKYKLFRNGQKTAKNGVGIFVREPTASPRSTGY